ncbi:50S ribosomal protein L3 [uncultured archaeon]|nr:50S ribosomal protein L3 [uncultured archaeon]
MGRINKPKASALQYWPRKRAERLIPNVNWNAIKKNEVGLMGFIGYKAGMVSVYAKDDTADSMTKGKKIIIPATVMECPEMKIFSVRFYKNGIVSKEMVFANEKELKRVVRVPKQISKVEDLQKVTDFDDVRVIVYTEAKKTELKKTPDMIEIAVGGTKDQKLNFVKEKIGKTISISEVFPKGLLDIRAVTKGKGLMGPVRRHGISLKVDKTEKGQRRPGSLGPWHPARVTFVTPQAGQMGFFSRVAYNSVILKTGKAEELKVNPNGFKHYGFLKADYLLLKGSVHGPKKRAILMTTPLRPSKYQVKQKLEVLELR